MTTKEAVRRIIATGACNKTIAREVGKSIHTVKWHVENLMREHGVRNRAALASVLTQEATSRAEIRSVT